jgi:hypothetical protein
MIDKRPPVPFSREDMIRRRRRNVVLGLVLAGLMALFYITTIVRIGGQLAERVI